MPRPFFAHATIFSDVKLNIAGSAIGTSVPIDGTADVVLCDSTLGAITVTLPLARRRRSRELWLIKTNAGGANVTVSRQGADVIGFAGAATVALVNQDDVLHVISDGAARWVKL